MFRLRPDRRTRALAGGRILIGGAPRRILRLTPTGAVVAARLLAGENVGAVGAALQVDGGRLARRLTDAGMAHPMPPPGPAGAQAATGPGRSYPTSAPPGLAGALAATRAQSVTVVVPVRDRRESLATLLAALRAGGHGPNPAQPAPASVRGSVPPDRSFGPSAGDLGRGASPALAVVVVDDGSVDGSGEVAAAAGATVLRHEEAWGPAAARNTGWRAATTEFVAFLDSDCLPEPGWLEPLVGHLADPAVAIAVPRVRAQGAGRLAAYEAVRGPLDLGPDPGPVAPTAPLTYAPAAAMVVRRSALERLGGFAEDLQVGEDVDLCWRAHDAGLRVRYEPAATVWHTVRPHLGALLARRLAYGTSAAPLAARHPGRLTPFRASRWTVAALGAAVVDVRLGALATAGLVALQQRRLTAITDPALPHPSIEATRLVLAGHGWATRAAAQATWRAWLPAAFLLAARSRRARHLLLAAALLPALTEWATRRPALDPITYTALRVADDAAYCLGMWQGCIAARTTAPLRPSLLPAALYRIPPTGRRESAKPRPPSGTA